MNKIITIKALIAVAMLAGFTTSPLLMAMQQPRELTRQMYIRTRDPKKTYTVIVTPSTKVGDIKKLIFTQEGIPTADQKLLFSGKELNDEVMIQEIDPSMNMVLFLIVKGQAPKPYPVITLRTADGATRPLELDSTTSTALRRKIQEVTGIDVDTQSITVEVKKSE